MHYSAPHPFSVLYQETVLEVNELQEGVSGALCDSGKKISCLLITCDGRAWELV